MATSSVGEYLELMTKTDNYHKKAQWQEKLRTLQEALAICDRTGFPEAAQRRQQVLFEIGGIRRRFGQYEQAVETLQQALSSFEHASLIVRAKILGELGVVYRHSNQFIRARDTFNDQYKLARETAIEAEAELCRAVGNEGMSAYNLSQQKQPQDAALLKIASDQLRERIRRAQDLRRRLLVESPGSKYVDLSKSWETIGMDRLTLCYVAAGQTAEAVRLATESQQSQTSDDPTVRAFSRFFYGNALWRNGQHDEALQQWNAPLGTCASAMALCKEPSSEHAEYLKLLAEAGVTFDSYDEQGFSALDYAALSDNQDAKDMIEIILDAFRKTMRQNLEKHLPKLSDSEIVCKIEEEIAIRIRQAQLRRQYRSVLQEHIRPELRTRNSDSIQKLRKTYAKLLADDLSKQTMLDGFHYVTYQNFTRLQRLPFSTDRLTEEFPDNAAEMENDHRGHFIIFFSYRWIGSTSIPSVDGPDDKSDTQWHRMMEAINEFLTKHRDVDKERLSLWIDCACINQREAQQRERGIDALPLAVMQCNAMISLVDEEYYERAWCAVEVMLIRELIQSYHLHDWWEHVLHSPKTNRLKGILRRGQTNRNFDCGSLKLTNEKLDRPKIDFLMRQSKLLGRDDL